MGTILMAYLASLHITEGQLFDIKYFLPKFIAGTPTDTLGGKIRLPNWLKQRVDGTLVRLISGKPSRFGLPDPDYKMYESHPVVNSLFLHHIGHGDITVRPNIERLTENGAYFSDGNQAEYDLILQATGYKLHYPFIDKRHLGSTGFIQRRSLDHQNSWHKSESGKNSLGR